MTGLLVALAVVLLAVVLTRRRGSPVDVPPSEEEVAQVLAEMLAIRRRFDLAIYKYEVRSDAARVRRHLRDELSSAEQIRAPEQPEHGHE